MEAYEHLAAELEKVGIKKSNMFGMPVLKLGKKPICGWWLDGINFKLEPGSKIYQFALSLKGAHMFEPVMKNGRIMHMKNWIIVPVIHEEHFMTLAAASITLVEKELSASQS